MVKTAPGDWNEMQRLVVSRIEDNSKKLDQLAKSVGELQTQTAILCDREERELLEARHTAMRVGGTVSMVVSASIAALWGFFRDQ